MFIVKLALIPKENAAVFILVPSEEFSKQAALEVYACKVKLKVLNFVGASEGCLLLFNQKAKLQGSDCR